jgi:hypothetical protein
MRHLIDDLLRYARTGHEMLREPNSDDLQHVAVIVLTTSAGRRDVVPMAREHMPRDAGRFQAGSARACHAPVRRCAV